MRRIKSARIKFISLVPRGANQLPVLYKSEDQTAQFDCIVKDDRFAEHGELTAIVYVPERVDSQGDVASAEVIKQMAHDYVREMGAVDVRHNTQALPREKVTVVESFIVQKGDVRFSDLKDYSGRPVDATGGWGVVIKVDDQELRRLYREGHWNGVSMFGPAIVEPISKSAEPIADALAKRLAAGRNNNDTEGNEDMDIKELKDALEASNTSLVKTLTESIVTGLAKALKPEAPADDKDKNANVIKFEGDPTNIEDVRNHKRRVRAALVKWDDPKSVEAYEAALAKEAGEADKGKSPEVLAAEAALAKAQAELTRIQKGSNQSPTDGNGKPDAASVMAEQTGLSKEACAGFSIGSRMAKHVNGGK